MQPGHVDIPGPSDGHSLEHCHLGRTERAAAVLISTLLAVRAGSAEDRLAGNIASDGAAAALSGRCHSFLACCGQVAAEPVLVT